MGLIAALTVVLASKTIAQPFSGHWLCRTAEPVGIHFCAECGNDDRTGLSSDRAAPAGPKRSIQAGMTAAGTGDTVWVAAGIYSGLGSGGLSFPFGENFTVRSQCGSIRSLREHPDG